MQSAFIQLSILSSLDIPSPYSYSSTPWNALYSYSLLDGYDHYWVWSIDCSEVYSNIEGYDDQEFYSSKVFVDGELVYDTYYSKDQYDYLKNNQEKLELKYFTIGRCSMGSNGYWHYAKSSIYCMRLYNKGLTEEEMLENYNVTRAYYSTISE